MKVKPIIFNTEMVRALLDGRKTVTRRQVKFSRGENWHLSIVDGKLCESLRNFDPMPTGIQFPCNIGDLLYVRETFCIGKIDECDAEHPADRHLFVSQCKGDNSYIPKQWLLDDGISIEDVTFKPSIHMPRHVSRITLKVTKVTIERVQDITEEQAEKEGANLSLWYKPFNSDEDLINLGGNLRLERRNGFASIWDSIYRNWAKNPYVWVIEFEVINENVDRYLERIR